MSNNNYLQNLPQELEKYGLCKTLLVRKETIHLKHVLTETIIRKPEELLWDVLETTQQHNFNYLEYIINRLRRIYNIDRNYTNNLNHIVKFEMHKFFPSIALTKGLKIAIILDFDGVVSKPFFRKYLYDLCLQRATTHICSANPTITQEWFNKNDTKLPNYLHAMKGKQKKLRRIIEIQKHYDFVFYVDNEVEYLKYAWCFGIHTFHYRNNKIYHFSMNTQ